MGLVRWIWPRSQRDLVLSIKLVFNHALVTTVVISLLNGHSWLNFWTTFVIYDISGKVTQKYMGKWLKNLWGNATKSWGNDTKLWGNDAKSWGNESKLMGKWLKIMGKWSKILWGIASTAKWLHPDNNKLDNDNEDNDNEANVNEEGCTHFAVEAIPHSILPHFPIILSHFPINCDSFPHNLVSFPHNLVSFPHDFVAFPHRFLSHFAVTWHVWADKKRESMCFFYSNCPLFAI